MKFYLLIFLSLQFCQVGAKVDTSSWKLIKTKNFLGRLYLLKVSETVEVHVFKNIDIDIYGEQAILTRWCKEIDGILKGSICRKDKKFIIVKKDSRRKNLYTLVFFTVVKGSPDQETLNETIRYLRRNNEL